VRRLALAVVLAASTAAAETVDDHLAKVRALYEKQDFVHAREELLAAYQLEARPELLFALGQVELNIGHFAKAIDYYQRFIATQPAADQVSLAEQAIGAARARLAEKPAVAPPPPPPPHREWDAIDTGITALGSAAMVAGAGMLIASHRLADDRSGRLSAYSDRISQAELLRTVGLGGVAVGALAVGGALLRWRLHLVDAEVRPMAASGGAGVSWVQRW